MQKKAAPGSVEKNLHRNTIFNDKNLWGNQIEYCSLRMNRETDSLCMRREASKKTTRKNTYPDV